MPKERKPKKITFEGKFVIEYGDESEEQPVAEAPTQEWDEESIRVAMWNKIRRGEPIEPKTVLDRKIYASILDEQKNER